MTRPRLLALLLAASAGVAIVPAAAAQGTLPADPFPDVPWPVPPTLNGCELDHDRQPYRDGSCRCEGSTLDRDRFRNDPSALGLLSNTWVTLWTAVCTEWSATFPWFMEGISSLYDLEKRHVDSIEAGLRSECGSPWSPETNPNTHALVQILCAAGCTGSPTNGGDCIGDPDVPDPCEDGCGLTSFPPFSREVGTGRVERAGSHDVPGQRVTLPGATVPGIGETELVRRDVVVAGTPPREVVTPVVVVPGIESRGVDLPCLPADLVCVGTVRTPWTPDKRLEPQRVTTLPGTPGATVPVVVTTPATPEVRVDGREVTVPGQRIAYAIALEARVAVAATGGSVGPFPVDGVGPIPDVTFCASGCAWPGEPSVTPTLVVERHVVLP